jgi:hypothetical protein
MLASTTGWTSASISIMLPTLKCHIMAQAQATSSQ